MTQSETGLLTPSMRAYLRGETDYENSGTRRNRRQGIRDRIRRAFDDFGLLVEELEPRDRQQVFEDRRSAPLRDDGEFTDAVLRTNELTGLSYPLEFIYTCIRESDIDMEEFIAFSIARVEARERSIGDLDRVEVSLDIIERQEADIEETLEKISKNEELTQVEYETLSRLFFRDENRFIENLTHLPIDVDAIENKTDLSMGNSLVILAHMMKHPEKWFHEDIARRLDDRVIQYFGLNNVLDLEFADEETEQQSELTDEIAEDL